MTLDEWISCLDNEEADRRKRIARFTVFGVEVLDEAANPCEWNLGYANLLEDLLRGKAVIIDE